MATVLFIGGVGPDLTQEDLTRAFSNHGGFLASSVVRSKTDGKCIGQAYVTVRDEDIPRACMVTQVGFNGVCVLPVDVDAWKQQQEPLPPEAELAAAAAPPLPAPAAMAAAAAAAVPRLGPPPQPASDPMISPSPRHLGSGDHVMSPWPGTAAAAVATAGGSSGGASVAVPVLKSEPPLGPPLLAPLPSTPHAHVQAVLDQMGTHLAANPWLAYNGKPHYTLLNETCQKRQMALQVVDCPGMMDGSTGGAFGATITVSSAGAVVCAGRGSGSSKKDAKHNAAAACLDQLLALGKVAPTELVAAMTCAVPNITPTSLAAAAAAGGGGGGGGAGSDGVGGGGGGGGSGPSNMGLATTAMALTQSIMQLGLYPRCEEVMRHVYAVESGWTKTILMVLNEYAMKSKMLVQHEELPPPAFPAGFRFVSRLTTMTGQAVAQAAGVELRSKQEARQAAAAALIEYLLANNITNVGALARGK